VNRIVGGTNSADRLQCNSTLKVIFVVLKRVPVRELAVGMYIHALEGSWLDHPFWRSGFLIQDATTLRSVQDCGVEHCLIDVAKGPDLPDPTAPQAVEPPTPAPATKAAPKPERLSLADEFQNATRLRARSAQAMRDLFSEARLGKAIDAAACSTLVDEVAESIDRHPDAFRSGQAHA